MRDHCSVTNDHNWCVKSPFHTRSVCRRDTRMKEGTCRPALCPGFPYGIWEEPILRGGKAAEARIVTSLRGIHRSQSGGLTCLSGSRGFCTILSRWGIVESRLWFLVAVANVCGDLTMCSVGRFTWMISFDPECCSVRWELILPLCWGSDGQVLYTSYCHKGPHRSALDLSTPTAFLLWPKWNGRQWGVRVSCPQPDKTPQPKVSVWHL